MNRYVVRPAGFSFVVFDTRTNESVWKTLTQHRSQAEQSAARHNSAWERSFANRPRIIAPMPPEPQP